MTVTCGDALRSRALGVVYPQDAGDVRHARRPHPADADWGPWLAGAITDEADVCDAWPGDVDRLLGRIAHCGVPDMR